MPTDPLPTLVVLLALSCSIVMAGSASRISLAAEQPNDRETIDVTLHDGILTLDLRNAPLREVLIAISEVAGFDLSLRGDLSTPTTQSFSLTLDEGIKRLVGRNSLLMHYVLADGRAAARRLTSVFVHGAGVGVQRVSRVVERAESAGASGVSPEEAYLEELCADETRTEECQQAYQAYRVKIGDEIPLTEKQ